jgi:deoxyribose-phosphate aldolase
MHLSVRDIAQMIEFSAVAGGIGEAEVDEMARHAIKYPFVSALVMPCYVTRLASLLKDSGDIICCTVIGFPSGAHATEIKVREAGIAQAQGCREVDMVCNVGALRSGHFDFVEKEIRAVVGEAADCAVKVILETHYLSDDEIKRGCEACVRAGAAWVKTSTGWAPTGAEPRTVALMKSVVGDEIGVKASGGIRTLDRLVELYRCGATRFGVGWQSALGIMDEISAMPGKMIETQ